MKTVWTTAARTQTTTPCNRCLAAALSRSLAGRTLEPTMRRYIQSLSPSSSRSASSRTRQDTLSSLPAISSSPSSLILSAQTTRIKSPPSSALLLATQTTAKRHASSSSNSRWKQRQGSDAFAREARVKGLKSRAAFKLLEMDAKYKLFKKASAQVVVDLGFAPGSWSQVALERTQPDGYILGIDLIPAQPPRGVSTIQGNFLSPGVQGMVKAYLIEEEGRRKEEKRAAKKEKREREKGSPAPEQEGRSGLAEGKAEAEAENTIDGTAGEVKKSQAETQTKKEEEGGKEVDEGTVITEQPSYIDMERTAVRTSELESGRVNPATGASETADLITLKDKKGLRLVDVVLSDMSAPWPQVSGFSVNSISNPYIRMMNTSGIPFRDHAGSMDLCKAALSFASDTLKPGGHFICKFYQGGEDKAFEMKLKKMFGKVYREKPESSRSESKESFFVALRRKPNVNFEDLGFD